ncbi:MAG: flagellar hook-associated protein FlgK [Arcobacter butzleri]|jgi:flagellar hook-associated protein 1 FlgK|nr:flagellar basal body protein [Arcobacteraceae bacterium]MDY0364604.1 flagellar basal body rod C-terminal domain-containing protein [Arcobacteraceae bacterium]NLO17787.1 flagellar hook-associated protein FlgK [Aliarcobacter butzleri]
MINALHVGQSGLNAAKTVVENTMNNIANENTPGYKKRVVGLSELSHSDARIHGRGVSVDEAFRITDQYVFSNLLKEQGKESNLQELNSMLADIESIFFESDESGLSSDLDRFFQAIEDLRANPNNEIAKNHLLNSAGLVVSDLKNIYSGIEDKEIATKNEVYADVDRINQILQDIGSLNEQIHKRVVEPNDLLDKRDQLEEELSKYVDITVDRGHDYELKIGGMVAVRYSTNIHKVTTVENYIPQQDYYATNSRTNSIASSNLGTDRDTITYKFDNLGIEVSVRIGEDIGFDIDGNGTTVVDENNYIRALVHKINSMDELQGEIKAYNGTEKEYLNTNLSVNDNAFDKFLMIKAVVGGEDGKFDARLLISDSNGVNDPVEISTNPNLNQTAINDIHLEIFDEKLIITSGKIKAMTENLTTNSDNNKFIAYKEMLDNFAATLSDITNSFFIDPNGNYTFGQKALDLSNQQAKTIGLFTGANVKSLEFNKGAVIGLTQEKLDYLAQIQWKSDIRFDGKAQDSNISVGTSFAKFFQTLQVKVSADKETNAFLYSTQKAVKESLKNTYDQLTKVDKDEEMINLIKFQAAYEANAKIITTVDEMIQTILGLKR